MLVNFVKKVYESHAQIFQYTTTHSYHYISYIVESSRGNLISTELLFSANLDYECSVGDVIFDKDTPYTILHITKYTDNSITCVVKIEEVEVGKSRDELYAEMLESNKKDREIKRLEEELKAEKSKSIWQLIKERFV